MKIAITGSSGLVGSNLIPLLKANGDDVIRIKRANLEKGETDIDWSLEKGSWENTNENDFTGIVHLAGENIASGRWTKERKERIRISRVNGTKRLCNKILNLTTKPKVLVCASAIGFYGDRGDETVNEESTKGYGFLSDVCKEWEEATKQASDAGIRVVNLRFGMILSNKGGALTKMLFPFKLGMGGKVGNGMQYMSWITIDDVINVINHALTSNSLVGAVNAVSPDAVPNHIFTKALGSALGRPTLFPMPAFAARLAFGEMADELLLSSIRVKPDKLVKAGYQFKYPDIKGALNHLLQKEG